MLSAAPCSDLLERELARLKESSLLSWDHAISGAADDVDALEQEGGSFDENNLQVKKIFRVLIGELKKGRADLAKLCQDKEKRSLSGPFFFLAGIGLEPMTFGL